MTVLRFSGGEVVEVALSLEEARDLVQQALERRVLLELEAPDGRRLIVNPQQVQILQDGEEALAAAKSAEAISASAA